MAARRSAQRSSVAVLRAFLWGGSFGLFLLLLALLGRSLSAIPLDTLCLNGVRITTVLARFWFGVNQWAQQLFRADDVSRELQELRSQVTRLQAEQVRVRELLEENRRLRSLLGLAQTLPFPSLGAEVIGIGGSNWFHTVLVNKGEQDGVPLGAPVISHHGLVGRVWEVRARTSIVLLLTDRHSAVGVSLTGHPGVHGIVKGTGRAWCELVHLSRHVVPRKGEVLVTSGLGGVFPKGIPVGEVISVRTTTEPPTVRVRPFLRLSELHEVIILTNAPPPLNP